MDWRWRSGLAVGGVLSVGAVQALRSVTTEVAGVPGTLPWLVAAALVTAALVAILVRRAGPRASSRST